MLAIKPKKKRKPLKLILLKNVKMMVTLSDRLKQAGIKECEPAHEIKTSQNLNKISKSRKNHSKIYSEKHAKAGFKSANKPVKKLRGLHKEYILPHVKSSRHQNEILWEDVQLKNSENLSKGLKENTEGSEKETIYVSLDFIKDCKKYRSKFKNLKGDLDSKYHQKNVKFFTSGHKQYVCTKEESQKLLEASRIQSCGDTQVEENFIIKDILNKKDDAVKPTVDDELKSQPEKKLAELFSPIQTSTDPTVSEVAKIDRQYLESLLFITKSREAKEKTNTTQNKNNEREETANENQSCKRKKITGKDFFESKRKNKEWEEKISQNRIENKSALREIQNDSTTISRSSHKNTVPVRIVRDLTKSEVQIKLRKEIFNKQRDKEMKSEKNVAQSKSKVNDVHRKRKTKNIILRSRKDKFFETPFSGEVSKVADVKELWRREPSEKSENSLSSHSSSTVPETEELPEWKNLGLESYKILERLVEEEVKKIAKISENKNNMGDVNDRTNSKGYEFISESLKEPEKTINEYKKVEYLKPNLTEVFDINNNNDNILKKRLKEAEPQQFFSTYEGEKPKAQLLGLFAEDTFENSKSKLKLLRENENTGSKIPGQIIENWSILNRLEQAFLALGTPTFPNKDFKDLNALKGQNLNGTDKKTSNSEGLEKKRIDKKVRKELNETKDSVNVWCSSPDTSTKITIQNFQNKKDKSSYGRNILKKKHAGIYCGKEPKNENLKNNIILLKISEDKENYPDQKRKELHKPTTFTVLGKSKIGDTKPRNMKKIAPDMKLISDGFKQVKANPMIKKKSYRLLAQSITSEEALERKTAFDIIAVKNHSKVQPRKSKSCTKIDKNSEFEGVKKRFLPTKNQEFKGLSLFEENVKEKPKSRSKSTEADADIKTKSKAMHNLRKSVIKEIPSNQSEKSRSTSEKANLKKPRENISKLPKTRITQENRYEKTVPPEELHEQILAKKKNQLNLNERAIKERSILSIRRNQLSSQIPTKTLSKIQKPAPDSSLGFKSNTEDFQVKTTLKDDFFQTPQSNLNYSHSSVSCTSTETYDLQDSNAKVTNTEKPNEVDVSDCQKYLSDISEILTSLSSLSISVYSDQQNNELKNKEGYSLWEQDIHYYHAIVKEIMSQYKRLDGFLKHSENSDSFSGSDSIKLTLANDILNEEKNNNPDDSQNVDIQEYRKKIMLEYKTLPFFEYKSKLQQKKENSVPEETKKKLSVVKDLKTEIDLDVKDYQPKVQKVLGSQLYVDIENLAKRNCPNAKCKEKKSSLQEIMLNKNENTIQQEECLRTSSTPKAFLQLPDFFISSNSSQQIKTPGSSHGDFSSVFTSSTYLEDTESETQ